MTLLTFAENIIPEYKDNLDDKIASRYSAAASTTSDLSKWKDNNEAFMKTYNAKSDDDKKKFVKGLVGDALYYRENYGLKYGDANRSILFL